MSPRKDPRCHSCHTQIVFFRRPGDGKVVPFDRAPVSSSHPLAGVSVHPIFGLRAWKVRQLVETLQVLHEVSSAEAERQVYNDLVWHQRHDCRTDQHGGGADG